jgi:hypothetical protein
MQVAGYQAKENLDMKKYLVDTSVFIDHFRGNDQATEFLKEADDQIVISGTTIGELLQGVRNKKEQTIVNKLFSLVNITWCTPQIEQLAHELLLSYYLQFGITYFDCLIAAHALEGDFQLVTHNIKHFKKIPSLSVIQPPYLS